MSKKISLIVLFLFILSFNVYASNTTESYKWLNNQKPTDVVSAALGALALQEVNGGKDYFDFLDSKQSPEGCWPKDNCKAKDTALALLVLQKEGKNVEKSLDWLKKNQKTSLTGDWILQIDTQETGTCDLEYKKDGVTSTKKTINVEKGYIKSTSCSTPDSSFNLGKCLENNLLSKPIDINIKCNFEGKISNSYKEGDVYYLNGDVISSREGTIQISNGNFDSYENTLFVNWVMKKVNYNLGSSIYLRKNYNKADAKSNAFLYLITEKPVYANELSILQKTDGSFSSVADTSIALSALNDNEHQPQVDLGRKWLESKQSSDGSWNKNIIDTALVLIFAYPNQKENSDLGFSRPEAKTEETSISECNNDNVCNIGLGETALKCPNDCSYNDKICDSSESSVSSPDDCKEKVSATETNLCGNNNVDQGEECDGTLDSSCPGLCTNQCLCEQKAKSSFWKYFLIIIILLIGGFILYRKFGSKFQSNKKRPSEKPVFSFTKTETKPERTEFKGPMNPLKSIASIDTGRKSKIEEDLEKSLKEAKRILEK